MGTRGVRVLALLQARVRSQVRRIMHRDSG
jgi:hypothetical protein